MAKCRAIRASPGSGNPKQIVPLIQDLAALVAILYSQSDARSEGADFRGGGAGGGKEEAADDDVEDVRACESGSAESGAAGVASVAAGAAGAVLSAPAARGDNLSPEKKTASPEAARPPSPPAPDSADLTEEIARLQAAREAAAQEAETAREMASSLRAELDAQAEAEMLARASSMTQHQLALLRSAWKAERAAQLLGPGQT